MIINFSEKVVESLISIGVVPQEDKELYKFGIVQGIVLVINVLTVIIIGLSFGMLWQSIVFMVAYIPVRTYAGGYHARTPLRCYLLSTALMTAVIAALKEWTFNGHISLMIAIFAVVAIFALAPVEDSNKPLLPKEKLIYRKKSRIILIFFLAAALLFWLAGIKQISIIITMAAGVIAIMLILGAIRNSRDKFEKYRRQTI